ncbi:MAG: hypothetical protein RLZZ72_747 [Actinomycetota bacterium]
MLSSMRILLASASIVSVLALSACSPEELVSAAADAAACTAMESTLTATAAAYQEGLVDSGLISQVDALIGEQVRGVLSSGLSQDLADLLAIVDSNESVDTAKAKVEALTASIQEKCSAVGVEFRN